MRADPAGAMSRVLVVRHSITKTKNDVIWLKGCGGGCGGVEGPRGRARRESATLEPVITGGAMADDGVDATLEE
eukprot:1586177-Prymnesium_polylepis.1